MTDPKNCIRHYEWVEPGTLELALPTNRLRLYFMEEGLVRCRYVSGAVFENIPSYGVSPEYSEQPVAVQERELPDCYELHTQRLFLRIRKADAGLEFGERATGRVICADAEGMGHRPVVFRIANHWT